MMVGSIIYFIPFFFVLNPALVLQGANPLLPALGLALLIAVGTVFICGGIQGYQSGIGNLSGAGVLEWPLRFLLAVGGFVLATPGGGIVPLSQAQMMGLAVAILVPTLTLAYLLVRRRGARVQTPRADAFP